MVVACIKKVSTLNGDFYFSNGRHVSISIIWLSTLRREDGRPDSVESIEQDAVVARDRSEQELDENMPCLEGVAEESGVRTMGQARAYSTASRKCLPNFIARPHSLSSGLFKRSPRLNSSY